MAAQEQLCDFKKSDSDTSVRSTSELELEAGRMLLKELDDDGEEEIFFGPMTDKEKLKSKKMRRKTKVFKPGFRVNCDKEEEEHGREGIGEELAGEVQSSQESADSEVIEVKDVKEERLGDCGSNISDMSPSSVSSQSTCSSSGNTEIKEDSKPDTVLLTQHTPSPTQKRLRSSESAIKVNTPPFSLVTVSPQADAAVVSEDYGSCDVELFNATESVTGCDSTSLEIGIDGSSRNENKTICSTSQSEGTIVGSCDATVAVNQMHCADESSEGDLSEVGEIVETDAISSSANVKMDAAPKHHQISNAQSQALSSRETVPPAVAKPTPSKTTGHCGQGTVIYSSPLLISTTVQRVQMQQPICYGNNSSLIPVPAASVVRMDNLETGTDVAHQIDPSSWEGRNVAPSVFCPTGHTAFAKPTRKVQVDDSAASQIKRVTHSQDLLPTPSTVYQSPSSNERYFNQATNNDQGLCTLPPSMLHKENVNPCRQPKTVIVASDSAVKYQVLSSVSSPIVSALCSKQPSHYPSLEAQQAPSPRVLQLSNRQASVGSPSAVARQRLIDEKRALLARLRAEKQELRQRIKEDNEKCFNMKLENAAALQSNMARGMTPVFDRLPARGCDGRAALTLTERELEVVTKLHTIRNSQHTASDRTQSPCHQAIHHRDQSRLHWREDLIMNIEELSSPSRPRCQARTILSKKGHNSVRRGAGHQPSSSSLSHSGQPRAKQHLLF